jgi:transposase
MSLLLVMVLGASSYSYAAATLTQRLPDFVGSTIRWFEFFNGVPERLRRSHSDQVRHTPAARGD